MNLFQQDIVPPSVRRSLCTCKTSKEFCLVHGNDRVFYNEEKEKEEDENVL